MSKVALITGVTGQDGSYLAELLLEKGYEVHGIKRRSSSFNTERIDHLIDDPSLKDRFILHYGDLADSSSIVGLLEKIRPDEIYNLGAQSHVSVSFEIPEYTANITGLGTLRLLEAMRFLGLANTRFYQASSSELFGMVQEVPQTEKTPFYPRSPYAVAKLFAYWTTVNYRESYKLFACNGILFNHESPRRGGTFVTKKICSGMVDIITGKRDHLVLGNLDARRDWGHAKEYVHAMWLMMQLDAPSDFVIATGEQFTVREFVHWAAEELGFKVRFVGEGLTEVGLVSEVSNKNAKVSEGQEVVRVSREYFRPSEVETLIGDSSKAKEELGWIPKIDVRKLCSEMIRNELATLCR